jgi:hypothetical protein
MALNASITGTPDLYWLGFLLAGPLYSPNPPHTIYAFDSKHVHDR